MGHTLLVNFQCRSCCLCRLLAFRRYSRCCKCLPNLDRNSDAWKFSYRISAIWTRTLIPFPRYRPRYCYASLCVVTWPFHTVLVCAEYNHHVDEWILNSIKIVYYSRGKYHMGIQCPDTTLWGHQRICQANTCRNSCTFSCDGSHGISVDGRRGRKARP